MAGDAGLGAAFSRAVEVIAAASGRVIVTGMGKSGHIGRKIAATLASTGQPASFVHPAEASHGDLGMVQNGDVVLGVSWSGETVELAAIITFAKRYAIPLIAMTANSESALGREADVCLTLPNADEACPNGLAPTTSTTMQLVLGDALAIALIEGRGFTAARFPRPPSGRQARRELQHVRDVMHTGERIPRIARARAWPRRSSKCRRRASAAWRRSRRQARRHRHRRRPAPPSRSRLLARHAGRRGDDQEAAHDRPGRARRRGAWKASATRSPPSLVVERGAVVGIVHFHDLMRIGAV